MGSPVHAQLIALTAAALTVLAGCERAPSPASSLLLITTGGLRAEALSCYGGTGSDSEAICELAERGALFVWAFSTQPETAPAAATLLTSLLPEEHNVTASAVTFLATGTPTLATELSRAGYNTAAFVSSEELNRSRNFQLGFERYAVTAGGTAGEAADRTSEAFTTWLARATRAERPWFAWVHYPTVGQPEARGFALSDLDAQVATIVEAARAAAEPEIGIAFGALRGAHRAHAPPLALERVRVPLIWTPPGGVATQRLVAPVALLDLGPTWLQEAGIRDGPPTSGEPLRVAPLPPAAVQPARSLTLSSGDEVGVVLSRRFYARPVGAREARTALLSNDGSRPATRRVGVGSKAALAYEALLERQALDLPPTGRP